MASGRLKSVLCSSVAAAGLASAAPALAGDVEARSRIDSVVVYPDGAAVTRSASIDLPQGPSAVFIRGVPASVDPNSVRVEGLSEGDLSIGAVDIRTTPGDPDAAANPELERQLTALRQERETLVARLQALEGKKATIELYGRASPEKLAPDSAPLPVEKWQAAWDVLAEALASVNVALVEQNRQLADLDRRIAALEQATPKGGRPGAPLRDLVIAVEAAAPAKGALRVTYRVPGAGWTPVYDIKLDTGGKDAKPSLNVVRRARIAQRTGEDWADVAISVSTVRASRGTAAPDPQPMLVSLYEPVYAAPASPRALNAPAPAMQDEVARKDAANAAGAMRQAVEQVAQLESGGFQATFLIPGKVTVPQDGAPKSLALSSRAAEPTLAVRVVPYLDETAYLEAAFTHEEDAPLLPGEITLTRDGTYVGRGRMKLVAPGDRVELGFGADDKVKVSRVPVRKRETEPGWVGNTKTDLREFKTTVRNMHATPLRITVIDQLPVSENTAVVVEQLPSTTPPTDKAVADKRGVTAWAWDYQPGEQKEIRLAYRLKWPADRELVFPGQRPMPLR